MTPDPTPVIIGKGTRVTLCLDHITSATEYCESLEIPSGSIGITTRPLNGNEIGYSLVEFDSFPGKQPRINNRMLISIE